MVAHLDWRVQNLAVDGPAVVAVHDWDSVGVAPEAVAAGQAAAQFSTDWTVGWQTLPTVAEMPAFVRDYEEARGWYFTADERRVLDAANLLLCAYGARCEHSDRRLHPELAGPPDRGWGALLEARGLGALR